MGHRTAQWFDIDVISSINPATEETLAEFEPWTTERVDEAVGRVAAAQPISSAIGRDATER